MEYFCVVYWLGRSILSIVTSAVQEPVPVTSELPGELIKSIQLGFQDQTVSALLLVVVVVVFNPEGYFFSS